MGRSGGDTDLEEESLCCAEGVRRIVTTGKATFNICPRDQSCCPGLVERQKFYKDRLTITECAIVSSKLL